MHFKEDVLSQFKDMRSYERIDLICSLMDLCLPFELRFLGTCLEFLGKRDFYELREDERLANNVNHISQFRSLTDENTRRKLVLYVSLLKSCNSDCANCFNDTLAALSISDVNLSCRSEAKSAAKTIDEFLLLYTIALKHPAFSIHQKSEFAALLALLQNEDGKLTHALHSSKDLICDASENYLADNQNQLQSPPSGVIEDSDNSSQISAKSQASPLTCHVLSGSSYGMDALSPTLSQASTASLGALPHSSSDNPDLIGLLGGENAHTQLPIALSVIPVSSSLVVGPSMVMPLASSASHCILPSPSLPSPGEIGMQKGPLGPHAVLIGMPSESVMRMPYSGHAPWAMMMHVSGPTEGPGSANPSPPPVPDMVSVPTSGVIPTSSAVCTPTAVSCATFSPVVSNTSLLTSSSTSSPISASVEVGSMSENSSNQLSQPSSPITSRAPTPTRKGQMPCHSKPHQHNIHQHAQQIQQPSQMLTQNSPAFHLSSVNQAHAFTVGQAPTVSAPLLYPPQPQSSPPPQAWDTSGDNLKDVIGREMQKYSSLQDYSPDELLLMSDDQLREIGLSHSAILQLRAIMGKIQMTNGITTMNRVEPNFQNECVETRRRYQAMAVPPLVQGPPAVQSYGYMVPIGNTGSVISNSSNGGHCVKGNHCQQHHQIVHQMRAMQLEEDNRRPGSNSSSTSDCSSGSHSPPETPSFPHIASIPSAVQWDRGTWPTSNMHNRRMQDYHGRRGSDHIRNNAHLLHSLQGGYGGMDLSYERPREDERSREDRLLEEERLRGPGHRTVHNSRPRGISKAPPGMPSVARGRGHHLMDKGRRDSPLPSVPFTPVTSFIPPGAYPTLPGFPRFQPGSFLHTPGPGTYQFTPNGEIWSQYPQPHQNPPFMTPIVAFSPAHPPPKLSCYNCGGQGHQGSDCKESTFEEITQQGQYHLDYKPYKEPGDCRESDK